MSLTSSSVLRPIFSFVKKGGWGLEVIKTKNRERRGRGGGFPTGKEGEGEGRRPISDIIHVILALRPNL